MKNWIRQPIQFLMAIIAVCITPISGFGQDNLVVQQAAKFRQAAASLSKKGQPLAALVEIEKIDFGKSPADLQELAVLRSVVGDYEGALEAMDQKHSLQVHPIDKTKLPAGLKPSNAIDAIIRQSRDRQIVILNENHTVPMHREFGLQLALRLREEGFTYFAAEAFGLGMKQLQERRYPQRTTGHYIHEPVFGNFVREAMHLGFTPISYEPNALFLFSKGDLVDRINVREAGQCANLVSQIFAKDPAARVFVYVGGAHLAEGVRKIPDGREEVWMAARLAKATGLDPLTIDQTEQMERSQNRLASQAWLAVKKRGWFSESKPEPIVLEKADGTHLVAGGFLDRVDMQVFHPPSRIVNGRPDWLTRSGKRKPVPLAESVQTKSVEQDERLLVQVFIENENEWAVPIDQVVISPGAKRPVLLLPPGDYRMVIQNQQGNEINRTPLKVSE